MYIGEEGSNPDAVRSSDSASVSTNDCRNFLNLVLHAVTETSVPQITRPSTGVDEASLGATKESLGPPAPSVVGPWPTPISEEGTPGTRVPPGVPTLT